MEDNLKVINTAGFFLSINLSPVRETERLKIVQKRAMIVQKLSTFGPEAEKFPTFIFRNV